MKKEAKDKAERRIIMEEKIREEVYVTIEKIILPPQKFLNMTCQLIIFSLNSPNAHYRKQMINKFRTKSKRKIRERIQLNKLLSLLLLSLGLIGNSYADVRICPDDKDRSSCILATTPINENNWECK